MKTQKVYRAKAAIQERCQVAITARDHSVIVDEPKPFGDDTGMTPMELLLGALASCKSLVFKMGAHQQKITYSKLEIEVEGDFDSAGYMGDPNVPVGFSAIRTIYHIETSASKEQIEALMAYVESHCPVAATIEVAPKTTSFIRYL
ncbi:OsmC family protein [Ignatzschineria sp. LJL83]